MDKITYPQIKKIYGLSRQAGLNDEELHDLVYSVTRSDSIKSLSKNQGIKVIDRLTSLVKGHPPTRATPNQIWQINKLAEEMGWTNDPRRLRHFLENQQHVSHPSYLTPEAASKTIEALKNIKRRATSRGSV
ncbi:phage protein GemA/Gp16 family protein [Paenibacillus sp. M1]|uniref:Phage protein GemA/Gp16 family protein n=1 Tax=Paenibacillus haidiansis TaxID=1574488 RepID=A0ABU7VYJ0_9BACL